MVNILRVDGAQLEGIHYLRAFGNSDSIRDDVADAERVVCVGGSYIGAEVAASLTEMGKRCTIVEIEPVAPLARLRRGGRAATSTTCSSRRASRSPPARPSPPSRATSGSATVLTESGRAIDCDAVVVGAGVRPDTMLAGRAGLEVDDGIVCDSGLETSVEGIFAAGDCCSYESELHGGAGCASSTGTSPSSRAATPPAGCSATSSPTASSPTSSATSPTGRRSSTSAAPRDWDEVLWRGDRDERRVLGLVPAPPTASSPRSRSAAPRTCRTPAA